MRQEIDRVVAGLAPDAGPGMTPGARELFEEISATPPSAAAAKGPRFRLSWRISVPLVAGLAAAALAISWLLPGSTGIGPRPAAATLDIKEDGGFYVITVKNLFANPKRYESQLRSRGLDFTLTVSPASASLEGQILSFNEDITAITRPGACTRNECQIGLKVPMNYKGKAEVVLARKARPGEPYKTLSAIDSLGEPLHCVPYVGKSVEAIREVLRMRGVTSLFFFDGKGSPSSVPGNWYVHEGFMSRPGTATLLVGPTKKRPNVPGPVLRGCPKGR